MSRPHRIARMLIVLGASAAGLFGGHVADYRLVVAPEHQHALLLQTGHGYLPYAIVASAIMAVVAVLAAGRMGFLRGRGRDGVALRPGHLAVRLGVLQMASFVALELVERLVAGSGVEHLRGPLLWLGLPLQALAAVVAAALLTLVQWLGREAARVLARRRPPAGSRRVTLVLPLPDGPVLQDPFLRLRRPRGPPQVVLVPA
jgi:hypothetical protein